MECYGNTNGLALIKVEIEAAKVMRDRDVLSILVTNSKNSNEPIGIVTERDILYRVVAENKDPFKVTLKNVRVLHLLQLLKKNQSKMQYY